MSTAVSERVCNEEIVPCRETESSEPVPKSRWEEWMDTPQHPQTRGPVPQVQELYQWMFK